jgi:selenocysteine-specific elongation factor
VDRSFTLTGIGTVVTGTLWSGSLGVGDQIEILPAGLRARVRSVQVHDQRVERAAAGQRVAASLVGIDRRQVARGDVVVGAGATARAAHIVDARLELQPAVAQPEAGTRLHVHHGTRESPARLYPLGGGYAQLRLQDPIVAERGDHLILRTVAPPDTIGGGVVVDPAARRHGASAELVARLAAVEEGRPPPEPEDRGAAPEPEVREPQPAPGLGAAELRLAELLAADGAQPRTDQELAQAAGLDGGEATRAFTALERAGRATRLTRSLHFAPAALEELSGRIVAMCERDGSATIAGVRDELGTSRKYAQALVEHLDAQKVTLRRGDEHVLRRRQRAG